MANSFTTQAKSHVSEQLGMTTNDTQRYQVYGNDIYERKVIHKFRMSDCEDPEIYIAQPIYEWQQTEHGKWVMKHGKDAQYHMHVDPITYGYQVVITAHITSKRWTEYCLRFPLT
jgi:hypothetical protein